MLWLSEQIQNKRLEAAGGNKMQNKRNNKIKGGGGHHGDKLFDDSESVSER